MAGPLKAEIRARLEPGEVGGVVEVAGRIGGVALEFVLLVVGGGDPVGREPEGSFYEEGGRLAPG